MTTKHNRNAKATNSKADKLYGDCNSIAGIFKKLKEGGLIKEKIEIKIQEIPILNSNEFMDVVAYHRKLKNIPQYEFSKMIGLNEDSYGQYERGIIKLNNMDTINKIINILDIKDKIELPKYVKFIAGNPKEKIKVYIEQNNLRVKEFSKMTQIPERTIRGWLEEKGHKQISRKSYEKLKTIINI